MKGLYLGDHIDEDVKADSSSGVAKKIFYQIKTFKDSGMEMDYFDLGGWYRSQDSLIRKIERRLPFALFRPNKNIVQKIASYDFLYVRRSGVTKNLFLVMNAAKKQNPKIRILLEIPTYPFSDESERTLGSLSMAVCNKVYTTKMTKCVDRIITFSDDDVIWNIPTIKISNAIDFDSAKRKIVKKNLTNKTIEIMVCAQFTFWHGYDRAIKGFLDYLSQPDGKKYKIILHIVGNDQDGELQKYKDFVNSNHAIFASAKDAGCVVFHGLQSGADLENIYDQCVIGLDSMGRHRSKVYFNSSLKGKEYLAKGLVVVSGVATELDRDKNFKYYFRVPADDSNIDFNQIISFLEKLLQDETLEEIQLNTMQYAKEHFDYSVSMKTIIQYLKDFA